MCLSPVTIVREIAGRKYTEYVPCGKCNECVKDKQNEYMIRSVEESKKCGSCYFFTLTYNEDSCPVKFDLDGEVIEENPLTGEVKFSDSAKIRSLNRADIVAWKKRVRERINKRRKKEGKPRIKFSFLITGEYGPKTHRPHYHGLFLGLSYEYMIEFKHDWETHFGFTTFKNVPTIPTEERNDVVNTARYVSKYICKLQELEDENVLEGKVEKPRKQVSVGFGLPKDSVFKSWQNYHLCKDIVSDYDLEAVHDLPPEVSDKLVREVIKRRRYNLQGCSYKLPNYYKRKLFYVKDGRTKEIHASELQFMVSRALAMDIRKDYSRKFASLVSDFSDSESPEAYLAASRFLRESEYNRRLEMSKAIKEANLKQFRKSDF